MARPRSLMPDDVPAALQQAGLVDDCARRPSYQRNDYLGWIMRARTEGTRERWMLGPSLVLRQHRHHV